MYYTYKKPINIIEPFLEYISPDTEFYIEAATHGDVHLDIYKNLDTLKYIANNSATLRWIHNKWKKLKKGDIVQHFKRKKWQMNYYTWKIIVIGSIIN